MNKKQMDETEKKEAAKEAAPAAKKRRKCCKDDCGMHDLEGKITLKVLGLEDACQVLSGKNNALLSMLALGHKLEDLGHEFTYYSIGQNPEAFVCDAQVLSLVEKMDESIFPITIAGGKILLQGRYPDKDDFCCWTGLEFDEIDLDAEAELQAVLACNSYKVILCDCGIDCADCHSSYFPEEDYQADDENELFGDNLDKDFDNINKQL